MQSEKPAPTDRKTKFFNLTLASITAQVGCLTLVIILGAVFGGLWLDAQYQTKPWFTVGLLIASIPISLILMFFVVRITLKKLKPNVEKQQQEIKLKEAELGEDA